LLEGNGTEGELKQLRFLHERLVEYNPIYYNKTLVFRLLRDDSLREMLLNIFDEPT